MGLEARAIQRHNAAARRQRTNAAAAQVLEPCRRSCSSLYTTPRGGGPAIRVQSIRYLDAGERFPPKGPPSSGAGGALRLKKIPGLCDMLLLHHL